MRFSVSSIYVTRRILLLCVGVALFAALLARVPVVHRFVSVADCRLHASDSGREECVYAAIEGELKAGSTGDALKLFVSSLPILPNSTKGCHDYAHRVGDIAYFSLYIFNPDSVKFTYPPESMVCDYGFYHGFYEHYFQEHPGLRSIVDTCQALPGGPEAYKRVIRQTCFHGAGHGLVLAQVDTLSKQVWGNIHAFTDRPLATCNKLTGLKPDEFRRCPLGVFAEIAQWRLLKNYGFSFDGPSTERFTDCLTYGADARGACILTNAIVSELKFGIEGTFDSCTALKSEKSFESCIQGTILGIFVNGAGKDRMQSGLTFCAGSAIAERGASQECYFMLEWALTAYFPESEQSRMCELFPTYYREQNCRVSKDIQLNY